MSIHAQPPGRRALAVTAVAGACLAATLALNTDQASAAYTAQVQAGTLQITGDAASDTLALELGATKHACGERERRARLQLRRQHVHARST